MKTIEKKFPDAKVRVIAVLLFMSLSCCFMLALRIFLTEQLTYIFLAWNLILALVPLWAAFRSYQIHQRYPGRYFLVISMMLLWLFFFPNAPYIITDFIHLRERSIIPLWFDAVLVFSFATTGLLSGLISLYFIHEILNKLLHATISWWVICIVTVLAGYGVYLGRVLRWNSWDILCNPKDLITDIALQSFNRSSLAMTTVFFVFLLSMYLLLLNFLSIRPNSHDR